MEKKLNDDKNVNTCPAAEGHIFISILMHFLKCERGFEIIPKLERKYSPLSNLLKVENSFWGQNTKTTNILKQQICCFSI